MTECKRVETKYFMSSPHGILTVNGAKATFIDEVSGISFFEDPQYGDETGLWAVYKGRVTATDYFSVPDAEEIEDPAEFFECYAGCD